MTWANGCSIVDGVRRVPVDYVEVTCRSALHRVVGMGFRWSLNPYIGCAHRCTFCYVRGFELRAEREWGEGYGRVVRAKVNVASVLRSELARRTWRREVVAVGTATDPYQPIEGRLRLTRACLEAFAGFRTPVQLITRGPLVVRDSDVLGEIAARSSCRVAVSVPSLDRLVWERTEPGTAPPEQRLRAVSRLAAAGIEAGVIVAPLLPGISDGTASMAAVLSAARDAGAAFVWASVVNLRPGTREYFLDALARTWPELVPWYAAAFADRGYLPAAITQAILGHVRRLRHEIGLREQPPERAGPPPAPQQLPLLPTEGRRFDGPSRRPSAAPRTIAAA